MVPPKDLSGRGPVLSHHERNSALAFDPAVDRKELTELLMESIPCWAWSRSDGFGTLMGLKSPDLKRRD